MQKTMPQTPASETSASQQEELEQWEDCQCSEPCGLCLGNTVFLITTLVVIGDLFTDIWVTIALGLKGNTMFAGICLLVMATNSLVCAFIYSVHFRYEGGVEKPFYHVPGCLLLNVPLHLGIIGHRFKHFGHRAKHCCSHADQRNSKEWAFAKLKLTHSILQSAPMLVINVYAILYNWNNHQVAVIQYFSAGFSFVSLVLGAVSHEKVRKERIRNVHIGIVQVSCIFIYKTLMLSARVLAIVNFLYFYHEYLAALLIPHFIVVFLFFIYVYRAIWKVRYHKIFLHALYCVLAYFPIHNDYRPEGEILMYYTIFIIENIIMISVPYAFKTSQKRSRIHLPGSQYYYVITVIVLVGSALGLCFMAIYYFLLHHSKASIQEQNLNWLSRFCIWSTKEEGAPDRPLATQSSPDGGSRFIVGEDATNNLRISLDEGIEHEHLLTVTNEMDDSGPPPSYQIALNGHHGSRSSNHSNNSCVEENGLKQAGHSNNRTSLIGSKECRDNLHLGRSSVLSGEEDLREYDSDPDQDTRPLHAIV